MTVLQNQTIGKFEFAQIVTPIEAQDLDCFSNEWLPILTSKLDDMKAKQGVKLTYNDVLDANVEDTHWEWPRKVADRGGQLQWVSYAVRCNGKTQGLMFLDMVRRCRHKDQPNEHMVYIDLLATAPWNRPRLVANPTYRGVGLVLMTEALLHSQSEGFSGRLGLHSLPGSESYYRDKWKMDFIEKDAKYSDLPYFEMTATQASAFLKP